MDFFFFFFSGYFSPKAKKLPFEGESRSTNLILPASQSVNHPANQPAPGLARTNWEKIVQRASEKNNEQPNFYPWDEAGGTFTTSRIGLSFLVLSSYAYGLIMGPGCAVVCFQYAC